MSRYTSGRFPSARIDPTDDKEHFDQEMGPFICLFLAVLRFFEWVAELFSKAFRPWLALSVDDALVGCGCWVVKPIRPGHPGKVSLKLFDQQKKILPAESQKCFDSGSFVQILSCNGRRVVVGSPKRDWRNERPK